MLFWLSNMKSWNLSYFQGEIFQLFFHPYAHRVPKWKIAHIWQSKEHKNNKITPNNVSQEGLQSLTDVLQHPVDGYSRLHCDKNCFRHSSLGANFHDHRILMYIFKKTLHSSSASASSSSPSDCWIFQNVMFGQYWVSCFLCAKMSQLDPFTISA